MNLSHDSHRSRESSDSNCMICSPKLERAQIVEFLERECLISRAAANVGPQFGLTRCKSESEAAVNQAKWEDLLKLKIENPELAYRGMQLRPAKLLEMLTSGMLNTMETHFQLSFGTKPWVAVPYSFCPARDNGIALDEPALSVIFEVDINALRLAGIRVITEPHFGLIQDVCNSIPARLFRSIFVYSNRHEKFIELSLT